MPSPTRNHSIFPVLRLRILARRSRTTLPAAEPSKTWSRNISRKTGATKIFKGYGKMSSRRAISEATGMLGSESFREFFHPKMR